MTLLKFEKIPIKESDDLLVDLTDYNFILSPIYYDQGLNKTNKMFLRKTVADKLEAIQGDLNGLKIKIWDGFRPRSVQNNIYKKFWEQLQKKRPDWEDEQLAAEVGKYVTKADDPERIPPHTTGGAVDLTLVDSSGKELNMGTDFDYFGLEAQSLYYEQSDNIQLRNNRRLLREAMLSKGFDADPDEWWHFDYGNQKWAMQTGNPFAFYGEADK